MLVGLIVSDALSCRVLPWRRRSPVDLDHKDRLKNTVPSDPSGFLQRRDRWRSHLTRTLNQLSMEASMNSDLHACLGSPSRDQVTLMDNWAEAILLTLPLFLISLDQHSDGAPLVCSQQVRPDYQASTLSFYQGLVALLNADYMLAATIADSWNISPGEPQLFDDAMGTLAWRHVVSSQGDFSLTVGQSLHTVQGGHSRLELPLISGLLSTAWRGLEGVPVRWSQALITPTDSTQQWLRESWHIADSRIVDQWAQVLWSRWLGQDSSLPFPRNNTGYPTVSPVI